MSTAADTTPQPGTPTFTRSAYRFSGTLNVGHPMRRERVALST
jgi:hypothetical protein